ncbi:MAG: phenylacetic acid degradation operon negative regulatory protein PaaX [Betaproteobacteria bacterium]
MRPDARDSRSPEAATPDPHVRRWIRHELSTSPPRTPSLVITVWGDAIAPHGGAVMLAGLIDLLSPFGINERLVRTSVFRLAREGWLNAKPVGRESLYRLTSDGAGRFEQAYRRIYALPVERRDDTWELVVANDSTATQRRNLQQELRWEGFGTMTPGFYLRPAQQPTALPRIIHALRIADRVVVARATDEAALGGQSLASAVPRAWDLARVAADYRRFLVRFGRVIQRFRPGDGDAHDPAQSFIVRTLLIHAYRRVLLRDPQLPAALLPLDWPGRAAFALCRDFYWLTHRAAERHLLATLSTDRGTLPPASADFYRRFGGE